MKRRTTDAFTLLCEKCGYVLEGLPRHGSCPECGKAIEESLPERRDRVPGVLGTLARPLQTLDHLPVGVQTRGLGARRAAYASTIAAVSTLLAAAAFEAGGMLPSSPFWLVGGLGAVCIFLASFVTFRVLTEIEAAGLRVLGNRRNGRITKPVASAIVGAGSAGWLLSAPGLGIALPWILSAYETGPRVWLAVFAGVLVTAGFAFFELFAYAGLHRMAFANQAKPAKQAKTAKQGKPSDETG